ncbi:vesicle budding-related protein [Lentinula raphanica]|nr:vesicle budding-related protein [Lentinula raphanica]
MIQVQSGRSWQVAWAHRKFGHILSSCSYGGKVLIWKEQQGQGRAGGWLKVYNTVNSVSWAPHELGAILACASSDGKISVFTFKGVSVADIFNGHAIGCNAVSWAPAILPGSLITPQQQSIPGQQSQTQSLQCFASAGCDNLVKIWGFRKDTQSWVEEETLEAHAGKTVLIWTKETSLWVKKALDPSSASASPSPASGTSGKFPDVVWPVSWSLAGLLLAVSCGDGKVTLWKENLEGFENVLVK